MPQSYQGLRIWFVQLAKLLDYSRNELRFYASRLKNIHFVFQDFPENTHLVVRRLHAVGHVLQTGVFFSASVQPEKFILVFDRVITAHMARPVHTQAALSSKAVTCGGTEKQR